jgi:uncharacterized protein YodC (DUF2158 family)
MAKLAPGEKVRLKKGGPDMVVEYTNAMYGVVCSYWNPKKNQKQQEGFSEDCLERLADVVPGGAAGESLAKRVESLEARVKKVEETLGSK